MDDTHHHPSGWTTEIWLRVDSLIYRAAQQVSAQRLDCANRMLFRARAAEQALKTAQLHQPVEGVTPPRPVHPQYIQGRQAFGRGEPISNAPFTSDATDAQQWRRGWLNARTLHGTRAPS